MRRGRPATGPDPLGSGARDRAAQPGCAADSSVERDEGRVGELGEGDVAGVVDGQALAELPCPRGEQLVGPVLDCEVEQVSMGLGCLVGAAEACEAVAADAVRGLEGDQARGEEVGSAQRFADPLPVGAAVEQQGDQGRGVADDAGVPRRSASRAARIVSASARTPVALTRARARAMTSSTGGRATVSTSMPRRYSCRDFPARAARAASSSRTSSGTPRTVMATLIAANSAAMLLNCSRRCPKAGRRTGRSSRCRRSGGSHGRGSRSGGRRTGASAPRDGRR